MSARFRPPPADVVRRVRALAGRRLTAEEFDAYVRSPMSETEREEIRQLIGWFRRRYPRPLERLESARRALAGARWRIPDGVGEGDPTE